MLNISKKAFILNLCFWLCILAAHRSQSQGIIIKSKSSVADEAGGKASSTQFKNFFSLGQSSAIGNSSSTHYKNSGGFLAQSFTFHEEPPIEKGTWVVKNSGTSSYLTGVSFVSRQIGWVAGYQGTILHTEDGGETWYPQDSRIQNENYNLINKIKFVNSKSGWGLVGSNGRILKTTDGGQNWYSIMLDRQIRDFDFLDHQNGWAVADSFFLVTGDGGLTWHKRPFPDDVIFFGSGEIDFASSLVGWVKGTENNTSSHNIWKTLDGGNSWINLNYPPIFSPEIQVYNDDMGYVLSSYGSRWRIYRTIDGGENWSLVLDKNRGDDPVTMDVIGTQDIWVAGMNGAIFRTNNGGSTWIEEKTGTAKRITDMQLIDLHHGWAVGDEGLILKYQGTPTAYPMISGRVTTDAPEGIDGVAIEFSNSDGVYTSNGGFYSKIVEIGWSGTVRPGLNDYQFQPANRAFTNVVSDIEDQDFIGFSSQANDEPVISMTSPFEDVMVDASFTIEWIDCDIDDDAKISLYYDSDSNYENAGFTLIKSDLSENEEGNQGHYDWDTSEMDEGGPYFILGVISDGKITHRCYSSGTITISHSRAGILVTTPDESWDFGSIAKNGFEEQELVLENTGNKFITISSLEIAGKNKEEFYFVNKPGIPFQIDGGQNKKITLKFQPTATGDKEAELKIKNDSENATPEKSIELFGTGVEFSPLKEDFSDFRNMTMLFREPLPIKGCVGGNLWKNAATGYVEWSLITEEGIANSNRGIMVSAKGNGSLPQILDLLFVLPAGIDFSPAMLQLKIRSKGDGLVFNLWNGRHNTGIAEKTNPLNYEYGMENDFYEDYASARSDHYNHFNNYWNQNEFGKSGLLFPAVDTSEPFNYLWIYEQEDQVTHTVRKAVFIRLLSEVNKETDIDWVELHWENAISNNAQSIASASILGPNNENNNPLNALGAPDDKPTSLGVGGNIVFDMGNTGTQVSNDAALRVYEANDENRLYHTDNNIDVEGFLAFVSNDTINWKLIGTGMGTTDLQLSASGYDSVRYIKIMDDGDGNSLSTSPGFDLDAIEIMRRTSVDQLSPGGNVPGEYLLLQNYPNPFNPTTVINFSLSKTVLVKLRIYNTRGQLVNTLINEQRNAGSHTILWDGKDTIGNMVSSGIYLCQLKAGNFTDTVRMIFLR